MRRRNLQIHETLLRLDECYILVLGDSTERFDEGIRSHDHGQDRAEDTDRSGQQSRTGQDSRHGQVRTADTDRSGKKTRVDAGQHSNRR